MKADGRDAEPHHVHDLGQVQRMRWADCVVREKRTPSAP
jgi:hypothetical protein